MGSINAHLNNARAAKNDFVILHNNGGSLGRRIATLSESVEHLLKGILAHEEGGITNTKGHRLVTLMNKSQTDLSQFETLIYDLDGDYTPARYEEGYDTELLNDHDNIHNELMNFIRYVESKTDFTH